MVVAAGMFAVSESFRDMTQGTDVLDALEKHLRSLGASHILVTGISLPGRQIDSLVLRSAWGEPRLGSQPTINADDPIIQLALRARRPIGWLAPDAEPPEFSSALLDEIGPAGKRQVVAVPIDQFLPYQGVVVAGASALTLDERAVFVLEHLCDEAFRRMFAIGYLKADRSGDLSARERRVVALSAAGKTANNIAEILEISQRTVHAHLQNASQKLHASNKTQTVVAALLYGQITV